MIQLCTTAFVDCMPTSTDPPFRVYPLYEATEEIMIE